VPPNLIYVVQAVSRQGFGEEGSLGLASHRRRSDGCRFRAAFRAPAPRLAAPVSGAESRVSRRVCLMRSSSSSSVFLLAAPQYLPASGKLSSSSPALLPHNSLPWAFWACPGCLQAGGSCKELWAPAANRACEIKPASA